MPVKFTFTVIVQEHSFSRKIDKYRTKFLRIDDVHASLDWLLGKNPLKGILIDDENHRIFKTTPIGDTPSFWVLYRYSDSENKVYLLSINEVNSSD